MNKVMGVGINDADYVVVKDKRNSAGKYVRYWICPFYRSWSNMLKRCYNKKSLISNPTYEGCSVCNDWLIFSNFKKWMENQDWEGKVLDKDLLVIGNKVYGPETCVFISCSINTFISGNNGVSFDKERGLYKAYISIHDKYVHLGRFSTENEAYSKWLERKHKLACDMADRETNLLVKNALKTRYLPSN